MLSNEMFAEALTGLLPLHVSLSKPQIIAVS